jgi:hypothetical protein
MQDDIETERERKDEVMFRVHMLAFMGPGQVREVWVPREIVKNGSSDLINKAVVNLGQNDRSPSKEHVSVSSGDVIEWVFGEDASRYYMVELIGFLEISPGEFQGMVNAESTPVERTAERLRLVNGMDPLSGMPGEMKLATLLVLRDILSNDTMCGMLKKEGTVGEAMLGRLRTHVRKVMDSLG